MEPNVDCICCFDKLPPSSCMSCPQKHYLCVDCYQVSAVSQMLTLRVFEQRQCKFQCSQCTYIFPDGLEHLTSDSKQVYDKSVASVTVARTQRAEQLQRIKDEEKILLESGDRNERVLVHFNEIVRLYFDMTCPGCRGGFDLESINFGGCMGMTCKCGVIFCMWCNASVGGGYGEHIKWCGLNPRRGSTHSSLEEVRSVKNEQIRINVPLYLENNIKLAVDRAYVRLKLAPLLLERGITL